MQIINWCGETIKRKKPLFLSLVFLTLLTIVLAVFASVAIDDSIFGISLENVSYINFLRGDTGFFVFVITSILTVGVIYGLILICFCNPYLSVVGVIFYLYFVYSQTVVFVSIILIYGFFNALIILILTFVLLCCEFALFMLIILELANCQHCANYFKTCFDLTQSKLLIYSLILLGIIIVFCLLTTLLKSFVILLVY